MEDKNTDAERFEKILELARKIESLTNPSNEAN